MVGIEKRHLISHASESLPITTFIFSCYLIKINAKQNTQGLFVYMHVLVHETWGRRLEVKWDFIVYNWHYTVLWRKLHFSFLLVFWTTTNSIQGLLYSLLFSQGSLLAGVGDQSYEMPGNKCNTNVLPVVLLLCPFYLF